ncbi:phosphogluconate dehydratase [Arenibaculum pallidiluteum]|uniref:phosphogluconate dehydratase n=1 Tax=Arenibaculum pallidiluteum TaxID=2812559 RepID=UPI001A966199|nr:phosphogluconate dehydratase [Arenibaculum pallidiluteum]
MTDRLNETLARVTRRIAERSADSRAAYLDRIARAADQGPRRRQLGCGNLAHGFAACGPEDKADLKSAAKPNIAIVTAYNDMLSAHQPYELYPQRLKAAVRGAGGVAQVAGGVPAMCDGVTQGRTGMELSLFSRDVIAMGTAIALSHDMFDGVLCLGICDKIVPGLMMGALSFGHLPVLFVPSGPMTSGLSNPEKARIRQLYAEGKADRQALLEAEAASYHGPGTCTFYGTANSNQMLMEIMGLQLPGSSFVNPGTPLRDALTDAAARRIVELASPAARTPIGHVVDEKAVVNGVIGLLATGGSTNHTLHLVAIAAAAGILLTWEDFDDLSAVVPLLARVYPNGKADVNHFHAAGGMAFLIGELLDAGLLHADVRTVAGEGGLGRYRDEPHLGSDGLAWRAGPARSLDPEVLAPVAAPIAADGGLRILQGNLGRAVIKVSAVKPEHRRVEAPVRIFEDQDDMVAAFKRGELHRDVVVVIRGQGPRANGMPELHKLTPPLGVLQDLGYRIALLTDGRMSGASGKVPAAIHLTPEAVDQGPIARLRDGDPVLLDAEAGRLEVLIDEAEFAARTPVRPDLARNAWGTGRELFAGFRRLVGPADQGAAVFGRDA